MKYLLLICTFLLLTISAKTQTSYTWNGATSTAFNIATNWTPNGVPTAADNITIVTGSNNCILNTTRSVNNITLTSGTLNLNGFILTSTGNGVFTAGTVTNGTLTISGTTANTALLTNTAFSSTSILNIVTGAITINGGTYGGAVTLNQTGATSINCNGGATFNSTLVFTVSGSGYFFMHGGCTYNGTTTFNYSGSNANGFLPELTTGSTYNGNLTLNNTATSGNIRMAYLGATNFNGNIIVSNTGSGNFTFCEQATATATLANGQTLSIGTFNVGVLNLYRFTQLGATAQNLALTGSATINLNNSTTFNGALTVSSPNLQTSNCTYNGVTILTKTDGTSTNNFAGGNTFNNTLTLNYTAITNPTAGTYWGFASGTPDIYNGDLYVNNSSADRILWGVGTSVGNQLNGNLTVTQTGAALGTALAWNAGTTWTQLSGKTISIGGAGFNVGYLGIGGLTTNSSVNLTTAGTSSIYLGTLAGAAPCTFGSTVNIVAPDIYVRGGTFNGRAYFTKTGGSSSNHNGGYQNIFNASCTINQQSSAGYFMLGYNSNEQFNDSIIVTATGTGGIGLGWNSGTGTPTLASGKSVFIGSAGFSAGYLRFGGFTQLGSAPINLTLTGTSQLYVNNASGNSTFGGVFNITAADIIIQGGTFNSRAYFTKTGGTNTYGSGVQNIYNGSCTLNQQSSTGFILLSYNSNDLFNDSIIVTSTGTGGIGLGWNGGTGTPTLASGKSVFVGAAGFSAGYLRFGAFTQLGSAPINLTLTGTSQLYVNNASGNSTFGGVFNITAADIIIQGGTFNSRAYFTKTGGTNTYGSGVQNIYNGSCTLNQQSSTGFILLSYNSNDLFNDSIHANIQQVQVVLV